MKFLMCNHFFHLVKSLEFIPFTGDMYVYAYINYGSYLDEYNANPYAPSQDFISLCIKEGSLGELLRTLNENFTNNRLWNELQNDINNEMLKTLDINEYSNVIPGLEEFFKKYKIPQRIIQKFPEYFI